jgi:ubiquinone/menaquinone biosynthesis C-methylase UbiE
MAHVCPWWLGYFLVNPIRKLRQDPMKILGPYILEGMVIADVGPGMGYFSLPMARMTGPRGRVVCIDLQEKMLGRLKKRAQKAGVPQVFDYRLCTTESLGIDDLAGKVDFALMFAMLHEVPGKEALLSQVHRALRPGGRLLFAEPKGHVNRNAFDASVAIALRCGFHVAGNPPAVWRSHAVLLEK